VHHLDEVVLMPEKAISLAVEVHGHSQQTEERRDASCGTAQVDNTLSLPPANDVIRQAVEEEVLEDL